MPTTEQNKALWYRRFRSASYGSAFAALIWTFVIVLPFPPFSYLPPILVGGGPGIWFLLAYLVFLIVGVAGFGVLSSFLHTIELHENRTLQSSTMWAAYALLIVGFASTCFLLAVAGALGGYTASIGNASGTSVETLLRPYVYPTTASTMTAVVGAALALYAMIRAGWHPT